MSEQKKKSFLWWLKTAGEAALWTAGYYGTELLQLFPEHTVANKIALPVGFALGFLVRKAIGMKNEYQKKPEQLPSGIEKSLDLVPNKITGIKGSKKNG
jgi:hypothetical protein